MIIDSYFNSDNLLKLYNEKLGNSNAKGIDKMNSTSFNRILKKEIEIIHNKIISGNYKFSPYIENLKLKGRNKYPRVISIPTLRDRIVLLTIKEILHKEFPENVNRKLPNSYIRDIKSYISNPNGKEYFIKLDIMKFYDCIDREILINKLKTKKLDNRIIELVKQAISMPTVPINTNKNEYSNFLESVGVPQGLSISNILAQIYLTDIDKIIDKRKYFYRRYVDDILILNNDFISNFRFKNIERALQDVKLELNDKKTEKGYLKNGFDFLSYKITTKGISIADKNVELFIRRIAGKFTWYKNGVQNKSRRPSWLEDDERFKEVFIEELNETITGIISSKQNYGWLFYFSELTDESLLFKIDKLILKFFKTLKPFNNKAPNSLKKLTRAFKVIKHPGNKNYICNYDNFETIRSKRKYLIFRGKIDPQEVYSDFKIEYLFDKFKTRQIRKLEGDLGYKYS